VVEEDSRHGAAVGGLVVPPSSHERSLPGHEHPQTTVARGGANVPTTKVGQKQRGKWGQRWKWRYQRGGRGRWHQFHAPVERAARLQPRRQHGPQWPTPGPSFVGFGWSWRSPRGHGAPATVIGRQENHVERRARNPGQAEAASVAAAAAAPVAAAARVQMQVRHPGSASDVPGHQALQRNEAIVAAHHPLQEPTLFAGPLRLQPLRVEPLQPVQGKQVRRVQTGPGRDRQTQTTTTKPRGWGTNGTVRTPTRSTKFFFVVLFVLVLTC
jgi:hypothetical protein